MYHFSTNKSRRLAEQQLRRAIFMGQLDEVKRLLPMLDIKDTDPNETSFLHTCAYSDKCTKTIVALVIEAYENAQRSIDEDSSNGATPLEVAFLGKRLTVAIPLINAGANYNRPINPGSKVTILDIFLERASEEQQKIVKEQIRLLTLKGGRNKAPGSSQEEEKENGEYIEVEKAGSISFVTLRAYLNSIVNHFPNPYRQIPGDEPGQPGPGSKLKPKASKPKTD